MRRFSSSVVTRQLGVAVLVAAMGLTLVPAVHATTVAAEGCTETNTYTFDPPLTTSNQVGTVTMTYDVTCTKAQVTTTPFSGGAGPYTTSGSGQFDYLGSCSVALLTGATQHAIFGGSIVVALNAAPAVHSSRKVVVLQPSNPCTDAGGQVSGTGSGPAWSVGVS